MKHSRKWKMDSKKRIIGGIFVILACMIVLILEAMALGIFVIRENSITVGKKQERIELSADEHQLTAPSGYTEIRTAEDLANINNNLKGNYILMNDIDMKDKQWTIIGDGLSTGSFSGTFDGNNYKISNISIQSGNNNIGMFGKINEGNVKNLKIENISVTATGSSTLTYVGALCGYFKGDSKSNRSQVENIQVMGKNTIETDLNTSVYLGGLIGYSHYVTVKNSKVEMSINCVASNARIGGMCGHEQYSDATRGIRRYSYNL